MGATFAKSKNSVLSPRTMKRKVSDFILRDSVAKSSKQLCDKEEVLDDSEEFVESEMCSPKIFSWLTDLETELTPNVKWLSGTVTPSISIHGDAHAYKILMGRDDSVTVSEFEFSRAPNSPQPELQLSLSPRSDVEDACFFPPTPKACSPRVTRNKGSSICTPTDVRRTQCVVLNLQISPKGVRLSRRGGMCALSESQVPEMIKTLRKERRCELGGASTEGLVSHSRISIQGWLSPGESNSSELLSPPHYSTWRRAYQRAQRPSVEYGGASIPF